MREIYLDLKPEAVQAEEQKRREEEEQRHFSLQEHGVWGWVSSLCATLKDLGSNKLIEGGFYRGVL